MWEFLKSAVLCSLPCSWNIECYLFYFVPKSLPSGNTICMEKASVRMGLVNQQLQFFCLVLLAISVNSFAKGCKHLAIRLDSLCSRLTVSRFILFFLDFFSQSLGKIAGIKKVYARRKCRILLLCQPMYPWFLSEKALHY